MILNGLQSVGPTTCKRLIEYFGNVEKIFSASYETLQNIPGISKDAIRKIYNFEQYFNVKAEVNLLRQMSAKFFS
jgi:excinuclease UvrABC nuclease subunit